MGEDAQLALNTLFGWVPTIMLTLGTIAVAFIGYKGSRRNAIEARTNPAYAELLKSDENKTSRLDKLEGLVDTLRQERRGLEDVLEDHRDKTECLSRELAGLSRELEHERAERVKLEKRLDWLKVSINDAEDWITRTVLRIRIDHPQAWPALQPLPSWLPDQDPPDNYTPIPAPPDDGQPENPDTNTPEGLP